MTGLTQSLVVVWREESQSGPRRWSLRRINPDGMFHGTIEDYYIRGTNIRGRLSSEDNAKLRDLANNIISRSAEPDAAESVPEWQGLLAVGPYANPKIIFRYRCEDGAGGSAADFVRIIELLRPYVESHLAQ